MSASVCGHVIAIAGQRLQLAFLALEPAAERVADPRRRRLVGHDRHQRTIVDRGLVRQQRHRIRQVPPAQRLLGQRQHVGARIVARMPDISASRSAAVASAAKSRSHSAMLKVVCLPPMKQAVRTPCSCLSVERQQQQRPAFGVVGDDDEGRQALARADLPLPGAEKIEALIGRGELPPIFEAAPDRLGLDEIVKNIDAGDAARFRPRWRFCRPAFDRGSHGHRRNLSDREIFTFFGSADLCKEMSTKGNDNAARRSGIAAVWGRDVCHPTTDFLTGAQAGARLFQRLCAADAAANRRRRRHPAVRARAAAARAAAFSRSNRREITPNFSTGRSGR